MRIGNHRYKIDWGHLLVIAMIALTCGAYLGDTLSTSMRINNILFVLPASIVALLLCLAILPQTVRREAPHDTAAAQSSDGKPGEEPRTETWRDLGWIALLVASFGAFVYLLDRIGFDLASWLFITLGLFICGERRVLALLLYPPIAAALIVLGFKMLIPYPIHTLIL